jgi:hypothetical protein
MFLLLDQELLLLTHHETSSTPELSASSPLSQIFYALRDLSDGEAPAMTVGGGKGRIDGGGRKKKRGTAGGEGEGEGGSDVVGERGEGVKEREASLEGMIVKVEAGVGKMRNDEAVEIRVEGRGDGMAAGAEVGEGNVERQREVQIDDGDSRVL